MGESWKEIVILREFRNNINGFESVSNVLNFKIWVRIKRFQLQT